MIQDKDLERYNRQMILKGFGAEAQQKLTASKVLVVGAGGLGCPSLLYLAGAGVGTIGIVDDDTVSLSDLHRQVLYTADDIGLMKVEAAATRLRRLNPGLTIACHPFRLTSSKALDIIRLYDWVVDGTDNFEARYMINDACVLLDKPLIYGAVSQYQGQVAVFNVADKSVEGVNYRDLFPVPPKQGEVLNCAEAGVLGVLPGIIGTMQAAEVIKLITGIGKPLTNTLLTYDIFNNEMYEVSLTSSVLSTETLPKTEAAFLAFNYDKVCHVRENSIVEIDATKFEQLRKLSSAIVIDVREKNERPLITTFAHRQIPMSIFKEEIAGIREHIIVLFCQHGTRSLYAAEMIREVFGGSKDVYSLKGGIVKWGFELRIEN